MAMIFDRDLVQISAGTSGGWVDITKADYTSYKGSNVASVEGRQVFESSDAAGWAKNGNFIGPREDGLGPLPHDWVHYQGFYRHGAMVLLSYLVGETVVSELWVEIRTDSLSHFTRYHYKLLLFAYHLASF